jgi:hypothetical protein
MPRSKGTENRTPSPARTQGGTDLQAPIRAELAGLDSRFTDHSARHENGGADEISVAGLSGVLADPQTPAAHVHSAADLTSGTIPDARFPATLPAISGANLTNLDAADLASGTIPDARFPATLPAANGSLLTNLDAGAIATGTLDVARLGGASGSFTTVDGKTVTVTNGLITAIV